MDNYPQTCPTCKIKLVSKYKFQVSFNNNLMTVKDFYFRFCYYNEDRPCINPYNNKEND